MKVIIVGNGGREDALAWKLSRSKRVTRVYIAPGNAGTSRHGINIALNAEDVEGLKAFALAEEIDLTVVGPELPLTLGITDAFIEAGLKVFGPSRRAAEIEGSKAFCKALMLNYSIPTAGYEEFTDAREAVAYVNSQTPPFVVKADGLAAGKGVSICKTRDEAVWAIDQAMDKKVFGKAGEKVIIEEFLSGEEASYLAITDGQTVVPLAPAQDHKAAYDGDEGPNTGGMGAYSPAPLVTPGMEREIMESVMVPIVRAMAAEGRPYKGVLYAGLMIEDGRLKVLEFNCRFGDPETQPILARLEDDLFEILYAAAQDRLEDKPLKWSEKAAVCVVLCSEGYPGKYERGREITGIEEAEAGEDVVVFHAGTAVKDCRVVTSGGRVLGVTALGDDIEKAIENAYGAVGKISWDGVHYRTDIGKKALKTSRLP
jgi:phosphoribosylamine--glycine ligase